MNTRINLYRDEFEPKFDLISATNTLVFGVIALIIMGTIFFGIWQDQASRQQQLSQVKSSIAAKQKQLDALTKQLSQRQKDPVLLATLEKQKMRLSSATELADKLKSLSQLRAKPLSTAFTSFAEVNTRNIWLSNFTINDTKIIVQGNISEPGALPQWLQSIGKTSFFNERKFGAATVFRAEQQLGFTIESYESHIDASQDQQAEMDANDQQSATQQGGNQ